MMKITMGSKLTKKGPTISPIGCKKVTFENNK